MIILAIETSCDDTCVALLKAEKSHFKILSNIVSSQVKIHKKWGGVVPALAKREHQKNLVPALMKALKEAGMLKKLKVQTKNHQLEKILEREHYLLRRLKNFLANYQQPKIDLIAVTNAHGLEPALWVGVNFAKALSYSWKKPILPVHHIEAHILANWFRPINKSLENIFPAICLVVSGGHTGLILMREIGKYKLIGETRDDAAGECFDKVAKILGLGYPGGPIISKLAKKPRHQTIHLPRPMIFQKNYDFSFSGLKTAVLYGFRAHSPRIRTSKKYIQEMCFETQQAIIDVLIKKTIGAAKELRVKIVILGGGVAANEELRKQLKAVCLKWKFKHLVPPKIFCTDNAIMVGVAAYFRWQKGQKGGPLKNWQKIEVDANLKI